jgi:hypothetical protein
MQVNVSFMTLRQTLSSSNTKLTSSTVASKHAFEKFSDEFGIRVISYLTENNPFRSSEFVQDCANLGQKQRFLGVGAHHQNRVERASQTIFNWSRIMLLHHILYWPQEARLELWPFAVDYSVWIWNHLPDITTRLSPIEVFTKSSFPDNRHLQRVRVFGCPVYVLHPTLQDAKKLPKWQRKSWRGIFLGFSPHHSTNVSLVLNPVTGSITPQYHVVFDEKFSTTVSTVTEDSPTSAVYLWDTLRADGYEQHQCLQDSSDDLLPPDSFLEPPDQTEPIVQTVEPPAIAEKPDVYPVDTPQPVAQFTPAPELPDELPDATTLPLRTTLSGRESKQPKHL